MRDPFKILITDDEARMRESINRLLSGRGYDIDTASGGYEAIGRVSEKSYDLVLLDMSLGDMNGYQVMEYVQENSPETEVVIITGDASIESAVEALKKGAYSYLKKPFEPEELINTAINALEHKQLVHDRKMVTTALKESEKRFRSLVEDSLTGISIIQDDRIVYQNPEHRKIFDGSQPDFIIKGLKGVHQDDVEKVKDHYLRLKTGSLKNIDTSFRFYQTGKNGSSSVLKWVQCRASRVKYKGRPAVLINMMDITAMKELEHQLMLKTRLTSLGRIAAGIAHEIRNPLTGINSYLYNLNMLCDQDDFDSGDIEMMKRISSQLQAASNKIEGVIKRVLDFSRPSPTRKSLTIVNHSLKDAVDLSNVTLRKMGIRLQTDLNETIPECYADPQLLEQVVLNLINNAAQTLEKHDREKQIRISSFTEKAGVCITVGDSGPGVAKELREQIFDPFFTTKSDGSGIGLSLVQRIINDHNGSISVGESDLGGAEFKIVLPFSDASAK